MTGRRNIVSRLLLAAVLTSLLILSVGCGAASTPKQLVIAEDNQYTETMDPIMSGTTMTANTIVYETLVSIDTTYKYVPGLADSWEVSADGLVWTFKLHKGIKFHDKSPFNADAVKWWLEAMQKGANSYMYESMTEAKAIDDLTLQLTFSGPFPNLLYNLSNSFSGIMSKEGYLKYGDEFGTKYAYGTGPFMLKEWVQNDHILLVRNPDYNWSPAWTGHKGVAKMEEILIRIIPEDATRVIELQSGNVHLMLNPPPPQEQEQFANSKDYFVVKNPSQTIQFLGMNENDPFFKSLKTRQAVGYAIDRQLINDTLYKGNGHPTTTYLVQQLGGDQGVSAAAPSFDLAKAKSLLAEAGWNAGSDGILVADSVEGIAKGTKFEVSYWTYLTDEFKLLAEATQNMLKAVGIKANIQQMDNSTYSAQLQTGKQQIILRQYGWDNCDILEWFHHSKNLPYPNYLGTNDPKLDAMLDEANFMTPLWADRDIKYQALHKYLIQTWYPWAPIRQPDDVFIGRSTVKAFNPIPLLGATGNIWSMVYLEK